MVFSLSMVDAVVGWVLKMLLLLSVNPGHRNVYNNSHLFTIYYLQLPDMMIHMSHILMQVF